MIYGYFFFVMAVICLSSAPAFAETYFAKVENGIITNVIVADKSFVDAQPGTWIETFPDKPGTQYAGVGYAYNSTDKRIIPLENPEKVFENMKINYDMFVSMVQSGLEKFYHPKIANMTSDNMTKTVVG